MWVRWTSPNGVVMSSSRGGSLTPRCICASFRLETMLAPAYMRVNRRIRVLWSTYPDEFAVREYTPVAVLNVDLDALLGNEFVHGVGR